MPSEITYSQAPASQPIFIKEQDIETALIEKLRDLKYTERPDIRDRASLEANFRQKFETLNRVRLTDGEFSRLLDDLTIPDVFTAARVLREKNDFTRDDGTPLAYTLVNIKDYIMKLLAKFTDKAPGKQSMNPEQLIGLISSFTA